MAIAMENLVSFSSPYFVLLLISFSYFCQASSQWTIRYLPGFNGPLPFHMETGYVGVGEVNEDQLFYYFVQSETNPKEDPLVMWLTGGPGCSAWSGLLYEIGPLNVKKREYNGSIPTLVLIASIIFVDSPVWTGFSYSRGSKDHKSGDIKSSKELHQFLRKWLDDHPKFLSNPLYIAGDSYSGLTLPIVVQEIANGIEDGHEPMLNLKGYLLGNPMTDYRIDQNGMVQFAHGMGLISDELYESAKKNCKGDYYTNSGCFLCAKDLDEMDKCLSGLGIPSILEPRCAFAAPRPKEIGVLRRSLENSSRFLPPEPLPAFGCRPFRIFTNENALINHFNKTHGGGRNAAFSVSFKKLENPLYSSPNTIFWIGRSYSYLLSYYYANNDIVRTAFHIREGTVREWIRCNSDIPYVKEINSSINYHLDLTTKGYRALIYSGDHDLQVPFVGTQAWIRSLNFSIVEEWRSWSVDGQVAGYTRAYANNLSFATVKGAGHTAPEYKPKECFAMFQRWAHHKPL